MTERKEELTATNIDAAPPVSTQEEQIPQKQLRVQDVKFKIFAANYAIALAGVVDASLGPLIPYIQPSYGIGLTKVAIIYLTNFCGWTLAAFLSSHTTSYLSPGGTLILGSSLQLLAHALQFWRPPFPLFCVTYFFSGIGIAFQDAQSNGFISKLQHSHRWLGVLHALYGVGALITPIAATGIASRWDGKWHWFYFIPFVLGMINVTMLFLAFRDNIGGGSQERKDNAGKDLRKTVRNRTVLLLAGFFLLYVGSEVTAGGWLVEFLIRVRGGDKGKVGYAASGFWGGLTLGRVLLAEPTYRLGEQRMTVLYLAISGVLLALFWAIDDLVVSAVTCSLFGFVIGPFYPTGISVLQQNLHNQPEIQVPAIAFVASVGQAGSAAFPFLTGAVADVKGVGVLRGVLVGLIGGMTVLWVLLPGVPGRGKWWSVKRPGEGRVDEEVGEARERPVEKE